MFAANPVKRKNLFAFINFNTSSNAIVRSDSVTAAGGRKTTYANANGIYNLFGNIEYGFPLKKLKSRIEIGTNATYNKSASFVNGERNDISTVSFGPNISYNFSMENKIELEVSGRLSINNSTYSLQPQANNKYFRHNYGVCR